MGTMNTAGDPKNYQPTTLIAPDGREFTPCSLREHNEVVGLGYRPAPTPAAEHEPGQTETHVQAETTAPTETQQPTETLTGEAESETPAPAETSAPADASPGGPPSEAPAPAEAPDAPANPAPFAAPRRKAGGK